MRRALTLCLLLASLALAIAGRHSRFLDGGTRTRRLMRGVERRLQPAANGNSSGQDFDFFYLVRQWPGNYCSQHACPLLHGRGFHFTIHGLWPNYAAGGWPQFCDPDYKFDEEQIDDLEGAMEEEWPSFMGTDDGFWEHEWTKHGTCSLPVLHSEHKYFKTVLKLHWHYNLAAALRAAGIRPHPDRTYSSKQLVRAIRHMFGVRPVVHCYDGKLSEIWMCIGKDLKPFDCEQPSVNDSSACDVLTLPPIGKAHKRAQRVVGDTDPSDGADAEGPAYGGDSTEEARAEWGKAWESSDSGSAADEYAAAADWAVGFRAEDLGAEQPIAHAGSADDDEEEAGGGALSLFDNPTHKALYADDYDVAPYGDTGDLQQAGGGVAGQYGTDDGSVEDGYHAASFSGSRLGGREAVAAEDAVELSGTPYKKEALYGSNSADDLPYAVYYDDVTGSGSSKSGPQAGTTLPPVPPTTWAVLVGLALAVACASLLVVVAMRYARRPRSNALLVHDPEGLLRAPLLEHADGKA